MKEIIIVLTILFCAGCQPPTPQSQHKSSPELVVAAAANLTDVFPELGQRFTNNTGIRVVFSFGATADLSRQIENGAPFDVFAAADTVQVDRLEAQGLLTPGTRALYARGRLVMWLPPNGLKAESIQDITSKRFERIAIAKPDVAPYGRAAVEGLRALGIWDQIEGKVVYGQSVSQTKQFAATGNAEVAFIPLALVKPGEGTYLQIDERLHQPIDQELGIVKASQNQAAARQFVDFLLGPVGQDILSKNGYFRVKTD
jgi:molybdate transport system substrate-binding protein